MNQQIKTATVSKSDSGNYKKKGLEFFSVMRMCLEDGEWNAVLLNGVHAAISLSDAICVLRLGKRSASQSHQDTTTLLRQACSTDEGRKNVLRLSDILNQKNEAAYLPRQFTEKEALGILSKKNTATPASPDRLLSKPFLRHFGLIFDRQ